MPREPGRLATDPMTMGAVSCGDMRIRQKGSILQCVNLPPFILPALLQLFPLLSVGQIDYTQISTSSPSVVHKLALSL